MEGALICAVIPLAGCYPGGVPAVVLLAMLASAMGIQTATLTRVEALDLCLACKGCKGDCPVNVDMATYKAEFLSHYWQGRLRPRQAYAFGLIDKWAQAASLWPGLVNLVTQTPGLSHVAKFLGGMPRQRQIPEFAPATFQSWFKKRPVQEANSKADVMLWPDTFNN